MPCGLLDKSDHQTCGCRAHLAVLRKGRLSRRAMRSLRNARRAARNDVHTFRHAMRSRPRGPPSPERRGGQGVRTVLSRPRAIDLPARAVDRRPVTVSYLSGWVCFGARAVDISRRHVLSRRSALHREGRAIDSQSRAALATSIAVSSH